MLQSERNISVKQVEFYWKYKYLDDMQCVHSQHCNNIAVAIVLDKFLSSTTSDKRTQ